MKKLVSLLVLFSLLFHACDKENGVDESRTTFEFIISEDYILENYEFWIVVSDNTEVLYSQQIQNGQTYETPEIASPLVDVHVFRYFEMDTRKSLNVNSYNDVKPIEWIFERSPQVTNLGSATVHIPDMENVKSFAFSSSLSRRTYWGSYIDPWSILLYQNPENILISYWPLDNSSLRFKWVQNVAVDQEIVYSMWDLVEPSGSKSYTIDNSYSYFYLSYSGYFSDYYTERYGFAPNSFFNSETNQFTLYYPQGLFENYLFNYSIYDDVDDERSMTYINYGSLPNSLPPSTYANISITNQNSIDNASFSIESHEDYHSLFSIYGFSEYQDDLSLWFSWVVSSKTHSYVSNPMPEIPYDIIQKSNLFNKSNLSFSYMYLVKHLRGEVVTYEDYINMIVSKPTMLNEKMNEYTLYYKFPSAAKRGETNFVEKDMNYFGSHHYELK